MLWRPTEKKILGRFAEFLGKGDGRNDARLIKELDGILKDALNLVYLTIPTTSFTKQTTIFTTEMRKRQNDILRDMAENVNRCQLAASESIILAQLLRRRPTVKSGKILPKIF